MAQDYDGAMPMPKYILRYSGVFDYNDLYKSMVDWFKSHRFWFQETVYKHKPGNEFGREEEIKWNGNKKVTEFYIYDIDVYFHIWELSLVEVIQNGKKKVMHKAKLEMYFEGFVKFDYGNRWRTTKFLSFLKDIYFRYVLKTEKGFVSEKWDELHYLMVRLHDLVKDKLNMYSKGYEYKRYLGNNY